MHRTTMPSWPAMGEDTKVRLRASCNACNESKVRCSQDKPTCSRCERNDIQCIYGLSRRTHKDAPPISAPPSQRARNAPRSGKGSRPTSGGRNSSATSTTESSPSTTTTGSNDCMISEVQIDAHDSNPNILHDYVFPSATEASAMHGATQMLDFSSLIAGNPGSLGMPPDCFSNLKADFAGQAPRDLGPLFGANNGDVMDITPYQAPTMESECSCHDGVTELLATMRSGGGGAGGNNGGGCGGNNNNNNHNGGIGNLSQSSNDQSLSIDTQLAKLRQCIVSSETSMKCAHGREDAEPIHIMTVALLIGYAIDDFKILANETSMRRSSSSSSVSSSSAAAGLPVADMALMGNADLGGMSGATTPHGTRTLSLNFAESRLSRGMLELEEDDEMDLRLRLYLLSFRKLERLLSQLTTYIQNLHRALVNLPVPSRHMAFVIVCDYTRLWLEKKAGDVKRLFSGSTGYEMIDSAYG